MSTQSLFAFLIFAIASSITPGPNNLLLMRSGVHHGFRATLPHMLGVATGFACLLLATGLGLTALFTQAPGAHVAMKWAGVAYFLVFAWRLATAPISPMNAASRTNAWSFGHGFAFQFVNPKGWLMAAGAFSSYLPPGQPGLITLAALGFALIALPCFALWVAFGSRLRQFLAQGPRRRVFNIGMAVLLLASLLPLLHAPGG